MIGLIPLVAHSRRHLRHTREYDHPSASDSMTMFLATESLQFYAGDWHKYTSLVHHASNIGCKAVLDRISPCGGGRWSSSSAVSVVCASSLAVYLMNDHVQTAPATGCLLTCRISPSSEILVAGV